MVYLYTILLVLFYYVMKAIMDKITHHWSTSIFSNLPEKFHQFCNPSHSWRNKWKNGEKSDGERFLGSSTVFVMFTDLWHLLGFIRHNIVVIIISINQDVLIHWAVDYIIYLTSGLVLFEYLYGNVLKLKKK